MRFTSPDNIEVLHIMLFLLHCVFRQFRRIAISDYWLCHVCPSGRMVQLGSHCTDFHEIWWLSIFRRTFEEIQVSLKSDENLGGCAWRPVCNYGNTSLNSSYDEKCFSKHYREYKKLAFVFSTFSLKLCYLWDNMEIYGWARHVTDDNIIQHVRFACCIAKTTDCKCG